MLIDVFNSINDAFLSDSNSNSSTKSMELETHSKTRWSDIIYPESKQDKLKEEAPIVETVPETPIVETAPETPKQDEPKITMKVRKKCPVHIATKEEKEKLQQVEHEKEHHFMHFKQMLDANARYSDIRKMATGLWEVDIIKNDNNLQTISVDVDGILFDPNIKFYLGRVNPGDEYLETRIPVYMNKETLYSLQNNEPFDKKYMIDVDFILLNKLFDIASLKEEDKKVRSDVLAYIAEKLTNEDEYKKINAHTKGVFRFRMSNYVNEYLFTITSSNKVLASNLDPNSNLNTNKVYELNRSKSL